MKIATLERKFKYNSITLPDPNQALSPDAVREFYSAQYPELASAAMEGPTTKDNVATWTFVRAVGSKGRRPRAAQDKGDKDSTVRAQVLSALEQTATDTTQVAPHSGRHADLLLRISTSKAKSSAAQPMPPSAFGIWG